MQSPKSNEVKSDLLVDADDDFWLKTTESSLDAIWDNSDDDIYALLED